MTRLLTLLPLTLLLTACPDQKKPAPSKLVQIKGNPMAFVEGRRMSTLPTMRQDHIVEGAKYQLQIGGFENVDSLAATDKRSLKGADPSNGERRLTLANSFYSFKKNAAGDLELRPDSGRGMGFRFSKFQGYWELVSLYDARGKEFTGSSGAYKLLNNSSSPDGARHSLLIFSEDRRAQTLMAVTIKRLDLGVSRVERSNDPYYYIFGKGVKVRWPANQPVTVAFCTPEAPDYIYADFVKALGEWQTHLQGRLELRAIRDNHCPSFDDVNTRTFGFAPDWVEIPGAHRGIYGWTLSDLNVERSELIDGDIFMLSKEIQEAIDYSYRGRGLFDQQAHAVPGLRKTLYRVTLHELGHLLGLHHMFDGEASVMDYEDVDYVADYDRRAVQALYPLPVAAASL